MVQKWYFWSKKGICASKRVYLDEKCICGPNIWIFGPKMVSWSKNDIFGPKMISVVQKWYFWPPPMLSKQIMLDINIWSQKGGPPRRNGFVRQFYWNETHSTFRRASSNSNFIHNYFHQNEKMGKSWNFVKSHFIWTFSNAVNWYLYLGINKA